MSKRTWSACAALLLNFACIATAGAAEAWQEYDKLINSRQAIGALGPTLFGDSVSFSNGALSFSTTDVSVPGNNALPVAITRTLSITSRAGSPHPTPIFNDSHFGDWELDLPHIGGTLPTKFAGQRRIHLEVRIRRSRTDMSAR